jgi:hypothetical protein
MDEYTCIYANVHKHMNMYTHSLAHTHAHTHTLTHVLTHARTHAHTHTHIYFLFLSVTVQLSAFLLMFSEKYGIWIVSFWPCSHLLWWDLHQGVPLTTISRITFSTSYYTAKFQFVRITELIMAFKLQYKN